MHVDYAALLASSPGHAGHDYRLLLLAWAADMARSTLAGTLAVSAPSSLALARPVTGVVALRHLPEGIVNALQALADAVAVDLGRHGGIA